MEDIHSELQEMRNPVNAIGMLLREMDYETDMEMERGFSIGKRTVGSPLLSPIVLITWNYIFLLCSFFLQFNP